jgi:uncharacterized protein
MTTAATTLNSIGKFASIVKDRVIVALVLLLAPLSLIDIGQASASVVFVAGALLHIAPFFIAAVLFAAYAKASGIDQSIAGALSGRIVIAVAAASLAGALSPFCSCGVIPVIAGMLAAGVPLAPVMAFCLASPIMDPETFLLTVAAIDVNFAIARTATAIGMGLLSGFAVLATQRLGGLSQPLRTTTGPCNGPGETAEISWRFWSEPARRDEFNKQLRTNGWFLGKWMILAFFIESLMLAYIPPELVAGFVGQNNALAIPLATLIGIPAYMNGYAAIPLISGMIALGMTKGAALAFATAGAVSSVPAALAVYALVRRPVFMVYLTLGLIGSMTAGYIYQLFGAA